jgi:hypothetical protein
MRLIKRLERAMGKPVPKEVTKAITAVAQLEAAIDALHAIGIRLEVKQKVRWTNGGNTWNPGGFEIELAGRMNVVNVNVPPAPRPLIVESA